MSLVNKAYPAQVLSAIRRFVEADPELKESIIIEQSFEGHDTWAEFKIDLFPKNVSGHSERCYGLNIEVNSEKEFYLASIKVDYADDLSTEVVDRYDVQDWQGRSRKKILDAIGATLKTCILKSEQENGKR